MTLNLSKNGADLIKHFEGLRLKAYKCPAGIWTIGYGHTGPDVTPGKVITKAQADELFNKDIQKFVDRVNKFLTVQVSQNLFDALVSFDYNTGGLKKYSKLTRKLEPSSLLKSVNAKKDPHEISFQFRRYVYGGGVKLTGLVRRREAEVLLANGLPWKTAATTTDQAERDSVVNVTVEPEWTRKETDNVIVNPTNVGSIIAAVGTFLMGALENAGAVADGLKSTAGELGAYVQYVPAVKTGIIVLMSISLGLVVINKIKKVLESKR